MSPALNGSSAVWHFEGSDTIEICNGITSDFYTELPHMQEFFVSSIASRFLTFDCMEFADHLTHAPVKLILSTHRHTHTRHG